MRAEDAASLGEAPVRDSVLRKLKEGLSAVTRFSSDQIDGDEPLETFGIDSVMIVQLNQLLAEAFPELSRTLFYEYRTLRGIADYLVTEYHSVCLDWAAERPVRRLGEATLEETRTQIDRYATRTLGTDQNAGRTGQPDGRERDIAIIGLSGRYPQAATLADFWENLKEGRECFAQIPDERWSLDGFFVTDPDEAMQQGRSYCKSGGFIDGFAEFDPLFFGISPGEARSIDPQERLIVQASWEALEDSGYSKQSLAAQYSGNVGVFVGITKTGFSLYGPAMSGKKGIPIFPHTNFGSAANRISYLLDLHGPSMPIDTMCSASLTAIHEACEHILRGECELALAGGVNLYLHPSNYVELCLLRMLSRDGHCRSFGAGGDGFVPGEGVGIAVLKRLGRAIADGDHIYGIIKGTSVNHGGKNYRIHCARSG